MRALLFVPLITAALILPAFSYQSAKNTVTINVTGVVTRGKERVTGCNVQLKLGRPRINNKKSDSNKEIKDRNGDVITYPKPNSKPDSTTSENGGFLITRHNVDEDSKPWFALCYKNNLVGYGEARKSSGDKNIKLKNKTISYTANDIELFDIKSPEYTVTQMENTLDTYYKTQQIHLYCGEISSDQANIQATEKTSEIISKTKFPAPINAALATKSFENISSRLDRRLPRIDMYSKPLFLKAAGISDSDDSLPKTRKSRDGSEMILISAGTFTMGDGDIPENLPHTVKLSNFYIYKNLVTIGQYREFVRENPDHQMPRLDASWPDTFPIVRVTWQDARDYAQWIGGDLPSEAQWEKAARGTEGKKYPWGDEFDGTRLWYGHITQDRHPTTVGFWAVSPYGCTDMAGNVSQWCRDYYTEKFWAGISETQIDPVNMKATLNEPTAPRVARGGSWLYADTMMFRTGHRAYIDPTSRNYLDVGFRCVVPAGTP